MVRQKTTASAVYRNVFQMLDRAGVPDDTCWRSMILYFREMKDYSHLSDTQKARIQALLTETLSQKDYSDERLNAVLQEYQHIIIEPHSKKIDDLLREASRVISSFQELLTTRYGSIESLEKFTVDTVQEKEVQATLVSKLQDAFEGVKTLLENDIRSLEHMASLDALTGVPNRRAFDAFMLQAEQDWKEKKLPLSVAMFDIDHFKLFNDTHGHRIGDQVLKLVAQYIARQVQPLAEKGGHAMAARFGGEEFVLVISGTICAEMPATVEKILADIRNFNFLIRDTHGNVVESGLHITVSAGIADCWDGWRGAFVENILDSADKALYHAKNNGRDVAALFTPDQPEFFRLLPSGG